MILQLASALSSLPASHPVRVQNSIGSTKVRLWLVLDKHFIAKPAHATSLPRFVSDTIYEMGGLFEGIPDVIVSASHTERRRSERAR